jgi:peptidoglycan/xylan/chitin deacetylase (PgdA/CDA1 family)
MRLEGRTAHRLAASLAAVAPLAVVTAAALAAPGVSPGAGAQLGVKPLRVRAASLHQRGLQLVWHLYTDDRFSPDELNRDHRSLCLLIERASTSTAVGELCVKHPGSWRHVRLIYRRLTSAGVGPGRTIDANVTLVSAREMIASFVPAAVGIDYRTLRWQVLSTTSSTACASALSGTLACAAKYPAFPALARLHTPQARGCQSRGPQFVYDVPGSGHEVALTFDDGPWPDTPQFLDVLEREHVHATFFQIGEQISTYGRAVDRRMLADGDMIGDHTWSHPDVSAGGLFAASQIQRTAGAIRQLTGGFTPCLFRAPGGGVSHPLVTLAHALGFTTIQWNVDPRDWARPGADAIYQSVVSAVTNGSIVIQHDGGGDRSETLAALPREIATLKRRGYRFVTVTELLGDQVLYR